MEFSATIEAAIFALLAGILIPVWVIMWHQFYECRPEGHRPHRKHVWDEARNGDIFCARCNYAPREMNEMRAVVREAQENE
jgi:hypothetical protein